MRREMKWALAFFGLAALLIVFGLVSTTGGGSIGAGTAAREGGAATGLFQFAYPVAAILLLGGVLLLLIRRRR